MSVFTERTTMIKLVAIIVLIGVAFADPITPLPSTAVPNNLTAIDESAKVAIEIIPYHVSIRMRGSHSCSGTIISKNWILTAAQCAFRFSRTFSIRAGSSYTDIGGSIHNVSRMIMHQNFTYDSSLKASNDIALIELSTPLTLDATRQAITLYESGEETQVGTDAVLSGYGNIRYHRERNVLLIQNVTIISKDQCKESYSYLAPDVPGQICADYSENNMDFCHNDPGGPLTVNGRLAGIVSQGTGCPGRGRPLVYTDVGYFRDWIKEHSGI